MKHIPFTYLLLTLAGLIALSAQVQAKVTLERITYRGWVDSYRFTAGAHSLVVVPEIGGRIMEYSLKGRNVIWENPEEYGKTYPMTKDWHNYGGYKAWIAPQELWGWGPDPWLDYGKANVELLESPTGLPILRVIGAPSLEWGICFVKEIMLEESGELVLKERMYNTGGKKVRYSVWDVTQVKTPCFVVFPLKEDSIFPGGYTHLISDAKDSKQFTTRNGLSITNYMGEVAKIGADSDGPWMAWFRDDLAYVKLFDPMQKGREYPDGGCSAEVFTSEAKFGYVEMEILGPMEDIEPGEYAEMVQRWRVFDLTQAVTDENRVLKAVEGMKGKKWIP